MNEYEFEMRERSILILGIDRCYSKKDLKKSFSRIIKNIHPDLNKDYDQEITNDQLTMMVVEAYKFLRFEKNKLQNSTNIETELVYQYKGTILEDDNLISKVIGKRPKIKDLAKKIIDENPRWDAASYYDSFSNIWPEDKNKESLKYKFGGIC